MKSGPRIKHETVQHIILSGLPRGMAQLVWADLKENKPAIARMISKKSEFMLLAKEFGDDVELSIPSEYISIEVLNKVPRDHVRNVIETEMTGFEKCSYEAWEICGS